MFIVFHTQFLKIKLQLADTTVINYQTNRAKHEQRKYLLDLKVYHIMTVYSSLDKFVTLSCFEDHLSMKQSAF